MKSRRNSLAPILEELLLILNEMNPCTSEELSDGGFALSISDIVYAEQLHFLWFSTINLVRMHTGLRALRLDELNSPMPESDFSSKFHSHHYAPSTEKWRRQLRILTGADLEEQSQDGED